jgi:L-cysteate sulfo-lyase
VTELTGQLGAPPTHLVTAAGSLGTMAGLILGSQFGAGYGIPTAAGQEAARLAARHDGLLLDQTYTAKAMAGLIQGIRDGSYGPDDRVVFFHTGGLAGLLATDQRTA